MQTLPVKVGSSSRASSISIRSEKSSRSAESGQNDSKQERTAYESVELAGQTEEEQQLQGQTEEQQHLQEEEEDGKEYAYFKRII